MAWIDGLRNWQSTQGRLNPSTDPAAGDSVSRQAETLARTALAASYPVGRAPAAAQLEAQVKAEASLVSASPTSRPALAPGYEPVLLLQPDPSKAKGTVLGFHGYTGRPDGLREFAERLYKDGYNVYIPRMSGHGIMDGQGKVTGREIPTSTQQSRYDAFVEAQYQKARSLGVPVSAFGLSGGGNLALQLCKRHPEVVRTAVLFPFLGPDAPIGPAVNSILGADCWTGGAVSRELDHVGGQKGIPLKDGKGGYTPTSGGQALAMLREGRAVQSLPGHDKVELFVTANDPASGVRNVVDLSNRSGGSNEVPVDYFAPSVGVRHVFSESPAEARAKVLSDVERFLVDGVPTPTTPPANPKVDVGSLVHQIGEKLEAN